MTRATSDRMSIAWRAMSSVTPEIAAAESPMIVPRNVRRHDETGWGKFEAHNWGEFNARSQLQPDTGTASSYEVPRRTRPVGWPGPSAIQIRGRVSVDFVRRCEIAEVLAGLQQDREQHAAGSPRALVRMKAKSVSLSLYRAAVRSMAVMRCPEKGSPKRLSEAYDLKEIGRSHSVSTKAYLSGRKRRPSKGHEGTRAALYLRVSTPDQKPDLQFDGLRAYAVRAGLAIIQDYCDVGVSGR